MKLAIIPPVSCIGDVQQRKMHLLLPQLFDKDRYEKFYAYMPKRVSSWSIDKEYILDNGAAEGYVYTLDVLHEIGRYYAVDEIVLPDVMGDPDRTFNNLKKTFRPGPFFYMYVAHGHSTDEVLDYTQKVISLYPEVTAIGLPRILFDTVSNDGGIDLRIRLAKRIVDELALEAGRTIDIHLLGSHPLWYREASQAASCSEIRSMDTSLPYMLASHGLQLTDVEGSSVVSRGLPQGLGRKKDYFDWDLSDREKWLAHWNTETMDRWVSRGNEKAPAGRV